MEERREPDDREASVESNSLIRKVGLPIADPAVAQHDGNEVELRAVAFPLVGDGPEPLRYRVGDIAADHKKSAGRPLAVVSVGSASTLTKFFARV